MNLKEEDVIVFKKNTWVGEGEIGVIKNAFYKFLIYEIEYRKDFISSFLAYEIEKIGEL